MPSLERSQSAHLTQPSSRGTAPSMAPSAAPANSVPSDERIHDCIVVRTSPPPASNAPGPTARPVPSRPKRPRSRSQASAGVIPGIEVSPGPRGAAGPGLSSETIRRAQLGLRLPKGPVSLPLSAARVHELDSDSGSGSDEGPVAPRRHKRAKSDAGPASAPRATAALAPEDPTAPKTREPRPQPRQLATTRAQGGLARELQELHLENFAHARAATLYRARQEDREANPWQVVEVSVAEPTPPAPEFCAVTHWNKFVAEASEERWKHVHLSFYEYRGLHQDMVSALLTYAEERGRTAELTTFLADQPSLTARGDGIPAQSVEPAAWALPWKQFIDGGVTDPIQTGLRALETLSSDIRGKFALLSQALDNLQKQDPADAEVVRRTVTFTLTDEGNEVRPAPLA
jgi:hypothetical protein